MRLCESRVERDGLLECFPRSRSDLRRNSRASPSALWAMRRLRHQTDCFGELTDRLGAVSVLRQDAAQQQPRVAIARVGLDDLLQYANRLLAAFPAPPVPTQNRRGVRCASSKPAHVSAVSESRTSYGKLLRPCDSRTPPSPDQLVRSHPHEPLHTPQRPPNLDIRWSPAPSPKCSRLSFTDKYDDWLSTSCACTLPP